MRSKLNHFEKTYMPIKRMGNRFTAVIAIFCCMLLMLPSMLSAQTTHTYTYDSNSDTWSWDRELTTASGDVVLITNGGNPTVTGIPDNRTSLTVNGDIILGQDITTTQTQNYTGIVTLGGTYELTSSLATVNAIQLTEIAGGNNGLTLNTPNADASIILTNATNLGAVIINNGINGSVNFNGIFNATSVTINNGTTGSVNFNGTFNATSATINNGSVVFNGALNVPTGTVAITNSTGVTATPGSLITASTLDIELTSGLIGNTTTIDVGGNPQTTIHPVYTNVGTLIVNSQSGGAGAGSIILKIRRPI